MSRKFLTPIVLPADPSAALEAATKQYVDGLVVVSASDPIATNPNAELWVDSDQAGPNQPLPASMPRGIAKRVGLASGSDITLPTGTTQVALDSVCTLTFETGRVYKMGCLFRAIRDGSQSSLQIKSGGVDWTLLWLTVATGEGWAMRDVWTFFNGDGVTRTLTVFITTSMNMMIGGNQNWLYVEDIGGV